MTTQRRAIAADETEQVILANTSSFGAATAAIQRIRSEGTCKYLKLYLSPRCLRYTKYAGALARLIADVITIGSDRLLVSTDQAPGELLKGFLQKQTPPVFDPMKIRDQLEVFTCPVYTVEQQSDELSNSNSNPPPPFTLAAECPIFSCVHKKVYGFPINHIRRAKEGGPLQLAIHPFYKAFESEDPDDQRSSQDQQESIDNFVKECVGSIVSFRHSYTCRYPELSLDGGKSYKPVFDFVPGSNEQVVVVAGLDGYGFKFGSLYGIEFLELLDTRKGPKGMEWPQEDKKIDGNIIERILVGAFRKLGKYVFTSKENTAVEDHTRETKKED